MALNCKFYQFEIQTGCHISGSANEAEEEDGRQGKIVHSNDQRDFQVIHD